MFTFTLKRNFSVIIQSCHCLQIREKKKRIRQKRLLEAPFHRLDDKPVKKKNCFPVTVENGFIAHLCPTVLFWNRKMRFVVFCTIKLVIFSLQYLDLFVNKFFRNSTYYVCKKFQVSISLVVFEKTHINLIR